MREHYLWSGRSLYAAAVIGFGVICLFYVDFVNSLQPVPPSTPAYRALAVLTGVVLLAIGLALLTSIKTQMAALALAALFVLWIVLLHVPSAFTNPALLRSPWWIRTFECLALAGAALILAGLSGNRAAWVRAGRIAFGASLPVFGALHLIYPENVAALVTTARPTFPGPMFWAYLTGLGHIAAGLAIGAGMWPRLAAIVAGFMYASWALTLHLPRVIDNPALRTPDYPQGYGGDRGELTSLCVCVAFWGAAWIVAGSLNRRFSTEPARAALSRT